MQPINGRAKEMADSATRLMVLLAVMGVGLAVLFTIVVGRAILQPLATLTKSFREIEQGNLDLVVQVKSRDELHQLAEAFNSMAAICAKFRRTDRQAGADHYAPRSWPMNSLPDAIAIVNPEGVIELSNHTAQRLFQLEPEKKISDSLGSSAQRALSRGRARGAGFMSHGDMIRQLKFTITEGATQHFLPHAIPITDVMDKHLLGVTLVLAECERTFAGWDEMKSGLISVVSHELKTPLTSIRMARTVCCLRSVVGPLTAKQTEFACGGETMPDRLQKIIEDLLDMGRLESGRVELDSNT